MQVTETDNDGLKRGFRVVVPAEEMGGRVAARMGSLGRKARLPGFRPGKVPAKILETRFGAAVRAEVVEGAVQETADALMKERGLRPAGQPGFDVRPFEAGGSLEYDLKLEVLPDFEPADLDSLGVERVRLLVEDRQIDETLERMATGPDRTRPLPTPRPAAMGDTIVMDFAGLVDGEPFGGGDATDFRVLLGSGSLVPGFEEQLVGAEAGSRVTVRVTFPADYKATALAGQDASFSCDIREIHEPAPVPVDDGLAREMGFDDLPALRAAISERLRQDADSQARGLVKRRILDKLAERHDFPVPESMVEHEFGAIWKQIAEARANGQLDAEDAARDEETLKKDYRAIAVRRVRLGLILSEIGTRNELSVTTEDINQAIMERARRHPGQEREVIRFFQDNKSARAGLQAPIFEDKVIDFISEAGKFPERAVTAAEFAALTEAADRSRPAGDGPAADGPAGNNPDRQG